MPGAEAARQLPAKVIQLSEPEASDAQKFSVPDTFNDAEEGAAAVRARLGRDTRAQEQNVELPQAALDTAEAGQREYSRKATTEKPREASFLGRVAERGKQAVKSWLENIKDKVANWWNKKMENIADFDLAKHTGEVTTLTAKITAIDNDKTSLEKSVVERQAATTRDAELLRATLSNSALGKTPEQIAAKLSAFEMESSATMAKLVAETNKTVAKLNEARAKLIPALEFHKKMVETHRQKLEKYHAKIEAAKEKMIGKLEQKMETNEQTIQKLKAQKQPIEGELRWINTDLLKVQQEHESLKNLERAAETDILRDQVRSMLEDLEGKQAKLLKERANAQNKLEEIDSKINILTEENKAYNEEIYKLRGLTMDGEANMAGQQSPDVDTVRTTEANTGDGEEDGAGGGDGGDGGDEQEAKVDGEQKQGEQAAKKSEVGAVKETKESKQPPTAREVIKKWNSWVVRQSKWGASNPAAKEVYVVLPKPTAEQKRINTVEELRSFVIGQLREKGISEKGKLRAYRNVVDQFIKDAKIKF